MNILVSCDSLSREVDHKRCSIEDDDDEWTDDTASDSDDDTVSETSTS